MNVLLKWVLPDLPYRYRSRESAGAGYDIE